jgi:hypothetical protein
MLERVKSMLVSSADKINMNISFMHLDHSYIKETIEGPGWNLVGHHVLSVPN